MAEKPPALLFDLDGTLVETLPDLCAATNFILKKLGLATIDESQIRGMIGGGVRQILQHALTNYEIHFTAEKLDSEVEELIAYYHDHIADQSHVFDNVLPILERAQKANIKLAIVTNKRYGLAKHLLTTLGVQHYFPVIIGGDTLPTRKPDKAMLVEAISQLDADPKKTIMIGDSEADILAANAAEVTCVCVRFGYRQISTQEMQKMGALLIDDYKQLPQLLTQINPAFAPLQDEGQAD